MRIAVFLICATVATAQTRINPGQVGPIIPSAATLVIPSASGQYAGSTWFGISGNTGVTSISGAYALEQGTLTTLNGPLTFTVGSTIGASCTTAPGITYSWIFDGSLFWVVGPGCTTKPTSYPAITGYLIDALFSTLSVACSSAVAQGKTLALTRTWDLNGTCAANIYAFYGGILAPSSGHTTTLTGSFDGVVSQHFSLSAGGVFATGLGFSIKAMYPQYWGAVGDGDTSTGGGTDDSTAIQNAINNLPMFRIPTLSMLSQTFRVNTGLSMDQGDHIVCDGNYRNGAPFQVNFMAGADNITLLKTVQGARGINVTGCTFDLSPGSVGYTATDGVWADTTPEFAFEGNTYLHIPVGHAGMKGGGMLEGKINDTFCTHSAGWCMDLQETYGAGGGADYGINTGVINNSRASSADSGFRISGNATIDYMLWETAGLPTGLKAGIDFEEALGTVTDPTTFIDARGIYIESSSVDAQTSGVWFNGTGLTMTGGEIVFNGQGVSTTWEGTCITIDHTGPSLRTVNISGMNMNVCSTALLIDKLPANVSTLQGGISITGNSWENNTATIATATNASPSVLTIANHNYTNGTPVTVSGALGNTAINGKRIVQGVSGNTFTLTDTAGNAINGNGAYTTGSGTVNGASMVVGPDTSLQNIVISTIPLTFDVPNYGHLVSLGINNPSNSLITALESAASSNNALAVTALTAFTNINACIKVQGLAHTLQAGANTLNLNGGGALAIKKKQDPAANIGTAYAVNSNFSACYNAADNVWQEQ
jgi:hypothetical protein